MGLGLISGMVGIFPIRSACLAANRTPRACPTPVPSPGAFDAIYESLVSADRALLILATGLGKTVIGGLRLSHVTSLRTPQGKYW